MKIGIVRRVDELGRVVLPVEIRKKMNISERDLVEFCLDGDICTMQKHLPTCVFCGSTEKTLKFKAKLICEDCRKSLFGL